MDELKPIHGLAEVSIFPLAVGWWFVLALLLISGLLILVYFLRPKNKLKHNITKSWESLAHQAFTPLKSTQFTAAERLMQASAILRFVAIQRYGREQCAGLSGEAWLAWLAAHAQTNTVQNAFNWQIDGRLLISFPYMPPQIPLEDNQIVPIINAIEQWCFFTPVEN